jgi:hypothetical protein
MGDIYENKSIFKDKGPSDYQEVDTRKIRASIADEDFDEKVYASKKVSRAEREEQAESSEDQ